MKRYSQAEILEEGFWDLRKSPIVKGIGKVARGVGGLAGAAVKGGAYLARSLAPELTNPLDRLEAGARGFKDALKQGWDVGSGGRLKQYTDELREYGYVVDETQPPQREGNNTLVFARRAIGKNPDGSLKVNPRTANTTFIVDPMGNIQSSTNISRSNIGRHASGVSSHNSTPRKNKH
jgi:hypothetical protein